MYYVYVHTVPNGKIYVGQTKNTDNRWGNGKTYSSNKDFAHDINLYGWDNIKHEIIMCCDTREEAIYYEQMYIVLLDAENENIGYNKTTYKQDLLNKYIKKKSIKTKDDEIELFDEEKNVFQKYKKPRTVALMLIDEWIFNERYKKVMIRRCLDGIDYLELSKETGISERQLKRIVKNCEKIIAEHI